VYGTWFFSFRRCVCGPPPSNPTLCVPIFPHFSLLFEGGPRPSVAAVLRSFVWLLSLGSPTNSHRCETRGEQRYVGENASAPCYPFNPPRRPTSSTATHQNKQMPYRACTCVYTTVTPTAVTSSNLPPHSRHHHRPPLPLPPHNPHHTNRDPLIPKHPILPLAAAPHTPLIPPPPSHTSKDLTNRPTASPSVVLKSRLT
jgi:hypothetical protein